MSLDNMSAHGPAHGGEAMALAAELGCDVGEFLDFSSNTHYFAADLTDPIVNAVPVDIGHYPDPQNRLLHAAIATHEGVRPENVLAGNGSAELIYLALAALKPRRVLMLGPMFNEYAAACRGLGIEYVCYTPDVDHDFRCGPGDLAALAAIEADLAIVCSPNNPGGVAYDNLSDILESLNASHVLWDATYTEFLYGTPAFELHQACLRRAVNDGRVLCLCSFTKFFACPGLRLGYAIASPAFLAKLRLLQPSWSVGGHAAAVGPALLDNISIYRNRLELLCKAKDSAAVVLNDVHIFDKLLMGTSFVCMHIGIVDISNELRFHMLRNKIIIRSCDNITGMPNGFIRLQIRSLCEIKKFIEAVECYY